MSLKLVYIGFLFSLHVSLWGGEFILSSSFMSSLQTEKSKAIFKDYERFMNKTAPKPLHVKLQAVNLYLNGIVGMYDAQSYQQEDYWASRGEFLSKGGGDCEDYAIAKYFTLKDLGVSPQKMALCIVLEKYTKSFHFVLLSYVDRQKEPLVLDNLSFKLLPLSMRTDLEAKLCMNEEGYFKVSKEGTLVAEKNHAPLKVFVEMMQKNKNESLWRKNTPSK